jgi:RNA-directed DNA polymerase
VKIEEVIDTHNTAPQYALMSRLNPIIRGWSNYYSTVVSKETFNKVDSLTYDKLRAWARRRGKGNINKDKYWRKVGDRNWCFSTEEGRELARHSETPITRHVKVKGNSTAYDGDWIYWSKRRGEYPETPIIVATVLKTQKGKCIHCGLYFTPTDIVEVDHIQPRSLGGKDEYKNLQLLHKHCHDTKTENDGSLNRNYYSNPF